MRIPKTKVLASICLLTGLASITFIYLFSKSISDGFPYILPGTYLGEVDNLEGAEDEKPLRIIFEKSNSSDDLVIAISNSNSFAQIVENSKVVGAVREGELLPSVKISNSENEFQFSGEKNDQNSYSGKVKNLSTNRSGQWRVSLVNEYPAIRNSKDLETIREFLALKAELAEADSRINVAEISAAQQKVEIERLTHFVTEGESLKRNAEDKLKSSKAELEKLKAELVAKQKEVGNLNEKLELSQRLTPMGRLVSLARESLDRERRWVESMNKTSYAEDATDFDSVVGRGERILLLKNEIEIEKARLEKMTSSNNADKLLEQKGNTVNNLDYE